MADDSRNKVLLNICGKIARNNIKIASLILRCEGRDKNNDGNIHIRDLKEILNSLLPAKDSLTEREIMFLNAAFVEYGGSTKNGIQYIKLFDVLDESKYGNEKYPSEHWFDEEEADSDRWATQKGTLGEWLQKAACPAEIVNFKKFLARLEDYERSSGINCKKTNDGFIVPLGPDLKASIHFFTS